MRDATILRSMQVAGMALAALAFISGSTACAQQSIGATAAGEVQAGVKDALVPGDAIRLSSWREPQIAGVYTVDETGMVALPMIGPRKATQLPAQEFKRQLEAEYAKQLRNQEAQITTLRRVRVLGAVKNPGIYHVDATMNLADAIALAGGATHDGKLQSVRILRGGKEIRLDLMSQARLEEYVRSGDQIMVPQRSWMARNGVYLAAATISAIGILLAQAVGN
jgi:polysaccharide export outer membrane protein